jgi:hypothetical protein
LIGGRIPVAGCRRLWPWGIIAQGQDEIQIL